MANRFYQCKSPKKMGSSLTESLVVRIRAQSVDVPLRLNDGKGIEPEADSQSCAG